MSVRERLLAPSPEESPPLAERAQSPADVLFAAAAAAAAPKDEKRPRRALRPLVHTSLGGESSAGVLTSCYCCCCCSFLFFVTFLVLALAVTGAALSADASLRVDEELFVSPSILGATYGSVVIGARLAGAAARVNVSGYVVTGTPGWRATNTTAAVRVEQQPVAMQSSAWHAFYLVNQSTLHARVRTARVPGTGVGNLSARFFFVDEHNFALYRDGKSYHNITESDRVPEPVRNPSVFEARMVAAESIGLYYAVLENNDYLDMLADWNFTVARTKFNMSSVPIAAACSFVLDEATGPTQDSCTLDLSHSEDYYVVVSTSAVASNSSSEEAENVVESDAAVVVTARGMFHGAWRFGVFGVLAVLCAVLFVVTCFIALCCKRTTLASGRTKTTTTFDDTPSEAVDMPEGRAVPLLQAVVPQLTVLQPSPTPSPSPSPSLQEDKIEEQQP